MYMPGRGRDDVQMLQGTIAHDLERLPDGPVKHVSVEHLIGESTVELEMAKTSNQVAVTRSSSLRTARHSMDDDVSISQEVWVSAI